MSLWLVRAGSAGEYESKFLTEKKIFLTWDDLSADLSIINNRQDLCDLLVLSYSDDASATIVKFLWLKLRHEK